MSGCTAAFWIGAGLIIFPATSAYAQSAAEDAYRAYADGLRKFGIEVTNDPVRYDSSTDTLVVPNFRMNLSGSFEFAGVKKSREAEPGSPAESGKRKLGYTLGLSSSSMTLTGFERNDHSFHADAWLYPDGAEFLANLKLNGENLVDMDMTMSGIRAQNYTAILPEPPAKDPQHPASRWLPLLKAVKLGSYDSIEVDEIRGTLSMTPSDAKSAKATMSGTFVMTGYRAANFKDGVIGEYFIDGITQEYDITAPGRKVQKQTSSQGRTVYKDLNIGNFLALLDPSVPETGDPMPLLDSAHTEDYVSSQDLGQGQSLSIKLASTDATGLTVTKRDFDFLGFLDELLAGKKPAPEQIVTAVFQLYRSFGISNASMRDMEVAFPDPDQKDRTTTLTLGEIALSDASSDKIGEIVISDLDAPSLPNGARISLGKARLGDLEFAPYGPMAELIPDLIKDAGQSKPDPMRIARAFIPRSISYDVEDLFIASPKEGEVKIGKTELTLSTSVAPIPTDVFSKTDNMSIPLDALDDAQATAFLKGLGIENLTWSDETRLHWDEDTLELALEKLMIDIQGLGRAEASMKFANVPKALFEDPETQAQTALVSASFVGADISFVDAGVTAKAIEKMAQDAGVPETDFIQALVAQVEAGLQPVNDPAFTKTVSDAVADFLSHPGTFRIRLAPQNPVPVAQIVGSMVTPQVLPGLLNVQVTSTR